MGQSLALSLFACMVELSFILAIDTHFGVSTCIKVSTKIPLLPKSKEKIMKIVIMGSLGNISRRLTGKLTAKGHDIIVVSHNPEKAKAIGELGATAAIGSAEDLDFVTGTLKGAEAVYTMVPPNFAAPDYNGFSATLAKNYARAIAQTGIQYVVNLSSSASPLSGAPPFTEYFNLEENLDQLENINVLHLRPGFFYTNLYGAIPMIAQAGVIGNNFDENAIMVM